MNIESVQATLPFSLPGHHIGSGKTERIINKTYCRQDTTSCAGLELKGYSSCNVTKSRHRNIHLSLLLLAARLTLKENVHLNTFLSKNTFLSHASMHGWMKFTLKKHGFYSHVENVFFIVLPKNK